MLDNVAAIFGMSSDDIVKIIGALGILITTALGAYTKMLLTLHGARNRSFEKIIRIEEIIEEMAKEKPDREVLRRLFISMKEGQRKSDLRWLSEEKGAP